MDLSSDLLVFFGGFFAALIGSAAGGGAGGISFFALLSVGINPLVAIGTYKFADLGFYPLSLYNFFQKKQFVPEKFFTTAFLSVFSGILGALFIVKTDSKILEILLSIMLLFIIIFLLWKKDFGEKRKKEKPFLWKIFYFFSGIYNGAIGIAGGALSVFILSHFRGLKMLESSAVSFSANFLTSIAVLFIFFQNGIIDWHFAFLGFFGHLLGGFFGS